MQCCVCGRDWPDAQCQTLTLSEEEKEHVRANKGKDFGPFHYCAPCWKVLSDKNLGAQFIKGTLQSRLTLKGVPRAELWGQMLYSKLLGLKGKV